MNILALDTSTDLCSVALWRDGDVLHDDRAAGQTHSSLLLPMVDALLRRAGLAIAAMDAVAFGAGPGSFTGLRIACGVAQGLALGTGRPVVAVGTLLALAEASGADRVVCCLDARMHEVYHARYVRGATGWETECPPALSPPSEVPLPEGPGWIGCGSGFAVYEAMLVQRFAGALAGVSPVRLPHAREIAILGAAAHRCGDGVAPEAALPVYIRDKVALTVAEQR